MGVYSRLRESRLSEGAFEEMGPVAQTPIDEERTGADGLPGPATPGALPPAVANVGQRIQEIVDSADRIVADIWADAEAASKSYLDERQREADNAVTERLREFSTVTHSLAGKVERMQREASDLVQALEDARWRLAELAQVGSPGTGAPVTPATGAPNDSARGQSDSDGAQAVPEQAVLRATQMAVAGMERGEIEDMLRSEFGVRDPRPVVDAMLRPESP